jgi:dTDP-L-rhamnose 4-epimerase
MKVLVTGGAGFIGSNVARRLLKEKHEVTIFDNFSQQVHGKAKTLSSDLEAQARLVIGDVRDREAFHNVLNEQEIVVHLAAETGTGQSMYEVERYEEVNIKGTAILIDYLVNNKQSRVKKIVVASSRAIYGEGKYHCIEHDIVYPATRNSKDLKSQRYEPTCPICGIECKPLATDENSEASPSSFYGLTKLMQEKMVLMFAKTLGISAFALRYQNVYGPGQSLNNPYTGILAIFSNQARINQPIYIFEDGKESRDFVYIDDVVEATFRCIQHQALAIETLNVGSGESTSVSQVVEDIRNFFNSNSIVSTTGGFREGDIRHNFADITHIQKVLDFHPKTRFSEGILHFLSWAQNEEANAGKYELSLQEMREKGLIYGV